MCGIFGHVGQISEALAISCVDKLSHRGPNGHGLWQDGLVTLGHRRLAILDLTDNGRQPMSYADGRYWLTFNGEIYNFIEIRKVLIDLGYRFKSDSDSEVILASFDAWGPECVNRFNGMWAFGIWDNKNQELFLSRDRFGKKPLFYGFFRSGFAFASEMKSLAPLMDKISPNYRIFSEPEKVFYYESTAECLLKGILRLPAGHNMHYRPGSYKIQRYWNSLDHLMEVPENYEDQVLRLRELLLDACKLRMRADVALGTALSGGLDSSSVLGFVAHIAHHGITERLAKNWQHAFCASFPGTPIDEQRYAREMADYVGTSLNIVSVDPVPYLKRMDELFYLFEDYYITSPVPFVAVYENMKKNGVTVTLDGHGADELFGGYSFDYLHIIHDHLLQPQIIKEIINTYYQTTLQDGKQFKTLPPKSIFLLQQYTKNVAKKFLSYVNQGPDSGHSNWNKLDYFTQKLYISTHQTVLPTLLRNYDRYSMINGVEIRMPFLDHRVVSYAFSLPWHSKIRNGYTKAILRDAAAPFLPKSIAYRKNKIGFNAPLVDWMKGPLKIYLLDTLDSQSFKQSVLIDPRRVASQITSVINDPKTTFVKATEAWRNLSPYLWERSFLRTIKQPA